MKSRHPVTGCSAGCFAGIILLFGTILALPKKCEFRIGDKQLVDSIRSQSRPAEREPRLVILLCKFADKPDEIRPLSFYEDYYTRAGTGGLADYFRDVTLGAVDLTTAKVMGWYTMTHTSDEVRRLSFPGGRNALVEWGKDAARAAGVNLKQFDRVVVVQNWGVDHGAAGNGVVIVDQHREFLETTFIAHEMGHLFGLPHSFGEHGVTPCISATGEYCDAWDIMSAMNAFMYRDNFQGIESTFGPALNVFGIRALSGLPAQRLRTLEGPNFDDTIDLSPLGQVPAGSAIYAIEIKTPDALYTIEYRHKSGWDRGIPFDAVLVHAEKDGHSILMKTDSNSSLVASQTYSVPRTAIRITVESIDGTSARARVRVHGSR